MSRQDHMRRRPVIIHRIRIAARIPHCELALKTQLVQAKWRRHTKKLR
jgi:hypothetical protein